MYFQTAVEMTASEQENEAFAPQNVKEFMQIQQNRALTDKSIKLDLQPF